MRRSNPYAWIFRFCRYLLNLRVPSSALVAIGIPDSFPPLSNNLCSVLLSSVKHKASWKEANPNNTARGFSFVGSNLNYAHRLHRIKAVVRAVKKSGFDYMIKLGRIDFAFSDMEQILCPA